MTTKSAKVRTGKVLRQQKQPQQEQEHQQKQQERIERQAPGTAPIVAVVGSEESYYQEESYYRSLVPKIISTIIRFCYHHFYYYYFCYKPLVCMLGYSLFSSSSFHVWNKRHYPRFKSIRTTCVLTAYLSSNTLSSAFLTTTRTTTTTPKRFFVPLSSNSHIPWNNREGIIISSLTTPKKFASLHLFGRRDYYHQYHQSSPSPIGFVGSSIDSYCYRTTNAIMSSSLMSTLSKTTPFSTSSGPRRSLRLQLAAKAPSSSSSDQASDGNNDKKDEDNAMDKKDIASSSSSTDIPEPQLVKKRRRSSRHVKGENSQSTEAEAVAVADEIPSTDIKTDVSSPKKRLKSSPKNASINADTVTSSSSLPEKKDKTATTKSAKTKTKKKGATRSVKKIVSIEPPKDWELLYSLVEELRQDRTAPVDTDGGEILAESGADNGTVIDEKTKRFHALIALMLSSQTKDAIVGETMRRLQSYGLTVEHIAETSSEKLNDLIYKVGFRNNKTKYIKQTVNILQQKYDGDIPPNADELMELPGVGPKMAYIVESIAWDRCTGIGVDTHMHRIFNILKFVQNTKSPEHTRIQLQSWLPKKYWRTVNVLWVGFGQESQQEKTKLLRKAIDCSRPYEALQLIKRVGLDYKKEGTKMGWSDEINEILQKKKNEITIKTANATNTTNTTT